MSRKPARGGRPAAEVGAETEEEVEVEVEAEAKAKVGAKVKKRLDAEDVRRIALSLPGTVEKQRWGHPTFDVVRRMFVTVPDDATSFAVRCPRHERAELIASEPHKFWVPPHEQNSSWVRARLAALDDRQELYDILLDSWRQAAPPDLAASFQPGAVPDTVSDADPGTETTGAETTGTVPGDRPGRSARPPARGTSGKSGSGKSGKR